MVASKHWLALLSAVFILYSSGNSRARASEPDAADAANNLEIADKIFAQRNVEAHAREALALYQDLYDSGETSAAVAWRLAMAQYFVGLRFTAESKKSDFFRKGRMIARKATKYSPNCVECHFWAAVNTALYGQSLGAVASLFMLQEVRSHLERVIAIDPSYAYGGAYRILGIIEQNLPGALGGSAQVAEENFRKAIAVSQNEPMNYLFLVKLLQKQNPEKSAKAIDQLVKKGAALPTPSPERVESIEAKTELLAMQAKLEESPN